MINNYSGTTQQQLLREAKRLNYDWSTRTGTLSTNLNGGDRWANFQSILTLAKQQMNLHPNLNVILSGDFNEPSFKDYGNNYVLPITKALDNANSQDNPTGIKFIDAFRDTYPDVTKHPGKSYLNKNDVPSRVDYIFYNEGNDFILNSIKTLGGNSEGNSDGVTTIACTDCDIRFDSWFTDHTALLAEFISNPSDSLKSIQKVSDTQTCKFIREGTNKYLNTPFVKDGDCYHSRSCAIDPNCTTQIPIDGTYGFCPSGINSNIANAEECKKAVKSTPGKVWKGEDTFKGYKTGCMAWTQGYFNKSTDPVLPKWQNSGQSLCKMTPELLSQTPAATTSPPKQYIFNTFKGYCSGTGEIMAQRANSDSVEDNENKCSTFCKGKKRNNVPYKGFVLDQSTGECWCQTIVGSDARCTRLINTPKWHNYSFKENYNYIENYSRFPSGV